MAKETKSKRRSAGKRAFNKRVRAAKARGDKTIKVGKHRIPLSKFGGAGGKAKRKKSKGKRKSARRHAKHEVKHTKRARKAGARKSAKRSHAHVGKKRKKITTRTITKTVRGRGRTRTVFVTKTKRTRSGLAENPLTGMEIFAGGLTMLLGLASADVLDRTLATHPLTASGTNFVDPGTDATGAKTLLNGQSVLAPMNLTRWLAGGGIVVVPFVAAAFVKGPTLRSSLQLFGFGAAARVLGKGVKDLVVKFMPSGSTVQRFYAPELAAENAAVAFAAAQPGATPPAAGAFFPTANLPSVGLGHQHHAGTGDMTSGSGDRVGGTGDRATTAGCKCGGACGACRARSGNVPPQQVAPGPPPPPPPPAAYAPPAMTAPPGYAPGVPSGYAPSGYAPGGYGPSSAPSASPSMPSQSAPTATVVQPQQPAAPTTSVAQIQQPSGSRVPFTSGALSGPRRFNPYARLQRVA